MKRQCHSALGKQRITTFRQYIEGANCIKQKKSYCNKCNITFAKLHKFDTLMKRMFSCP